MNCLRAVILTGFTLVAPSIAQAATATWDPNPETNIAGYILSYGTQSGQHTVSIDVGNTTTYQFFPPAGQRYYAVVQAYDTGGNVGPKSNEVAFDVPAATNLAPTLQQPSDQSSVWNTAVSLVLVGSDPEGAPLMYGAVGLPPGLTLDAATGHISGIVTTVGNYAVTVSVSDGTSTASRSFTWNVTSTTSTTTVMLTPIDSTLNVNTTNYVSDPRLYTYTWPSKKIANAIVMKFNLSSIPANATIESALLRMSLIEMDGATTEPTYTVTLHRIINKNPDLTKATGRTYDGVNAWTPIKCCHQNIPLAQADISPAQASLAVDRTLGTKTWDALAIVSNWLVSPATNYGLLLDGDPTKNADRYRYFASADHANATLRPTLVITFSTPAATSLTTTSTETAAAATVDPTPPLASGASLSRSDSIDGFVAQVAEIGDQQVRGDFDGDGWADAATFRPSTAEWRTWLSSANFAVSIPIVWGVPNDLAVAADYDGDRKTDLAVYRPSTGMWHVLLSTTSRLTTLDISWGKEGDTPQAFDYDLDGKADLALARGSGFDVLLSSSNYTASVKIR